MNEPASFREWMGHYAARRLPASSPHPTQENPMSLADRDLRERVLALAVAADPMNAVEAAERFLAFVTGENKDEDEDVS